MAIGRAALLDARLLSLGELSVEGQRVERLTVYGGLELPDLPRLLARTHRSGSLTTACSPLVTGVSVCSHSGGHRFGLAVREPAMSAGQFDRRCSVCGERRPCVRIEGQRICLECAVRLGLIDKGDRNEAPGGEEPTEG